MSSCSSESDCYFCPPHGTEYVHRTPFYATMGQPLVYYAQVVCFLCPLLNKRYTFYRKVTMRLIFFLQGGCKDSNPNCFVKAFRWYTQVRYIFWF